MKIKINNMPKNAIDNKHWKNPGASLYNELCNADNWEELLKETYLVAPISKITNNGRMKTPFSRSGCKYPHHVVHNGYLVLSKSGVRAAYCRLKQMGQYHGEVKAHIDSHLKELGMMNKDGEYYEDTIQNNFFNIEMYLQEKTGYPFIEDFMPDEYFEEKSHRKLKFDYRRVIDAKTHHELLCIYELKGAQITYPGHAWRVGDPSDIKDNELLKKSNAEVQKNITKKGNSDHQSYGQRLIAVKDIKTNQQWSIEKNPGMEFEVKGFFASNQEDPTFKIKLGEVETFENRTFKSTKIFKGDMDVLNKAEGRYKYIRGHESDEFYDEWARNQISIYIKSRVCRQFNTNPFQTSMDAINKWNNNKVPVAINGVSKAKSQKPIGDKYKITANDIEYEISKWNERRKSGPLYDAMLKCIAELKNIGLSESFETNINDLYLFENEIDQYDPPYNADEVIAKYGMDVYNRLAQDPAHKFRMDTGIELIHEEPSLEELNRIHNNWQLMSDQQKEISDKKSIELFGVNNEDHYIQLLSKYNNSSNYSIEKINNEYQLISDNGEWISRLKYFIYDDIPNFDWINIADVDTNEKYRHQGYMTILLNELINDMHIQHPTMGLYLLVRTENIPAIKLYEKLGFKILKTQASGNGEFYVMYLGDGDINQLKNTNFMTETPDYLEEKYTINNLPDTMYFASPDKMNKLNGNQLFMTPYKGIASLFIASRIAKNNFKEYIKSNFENSISAEYNLSYEEWWANDNLLIQPLRMAHISHNIKDISDTINGTASGYIYTIDISKIKDHLKLFKHTKDANREVIYSGEDIIPTNIEPWTMKWELKYDRENELHSFPGKIIYSNIQESMNWIESFVHDEEFRNNQSSFEYDKTTDFHENVGVITNIQSPGSLNKWMHAVTPAYASKVDNFYHDPSKEVNFNPAHSAALQPPKDIARSKKGSVFDKVELERFWFDKHGYKYATLCILMQVGSKYITHPFIVYQDGKTICWFENSLKGIDGSRRFNKLNDLIYTVIKAVKKEHEIETARIAVYYLQDPPKYGINNNQYVRYVQSQVELPLNDLPTRLFDESVEYYDEASHGKLQFDFREVIDYDTGHSLKIVYSLKDIKITHLGVAHNFDDSKIPEVERNIAKKGNVDHQSTGQEILAIIDRVTGKRLTSARTIGPYDPILKMGFRNANNWDDLSLSPENLKKLHDDCQAKGSEFMKQHIHTLTVGEIDNSATFKSTKWYSNNVGLLMNGQVVTAKSKKDKKEFIDAVRNGENPELKLGLYNRNNTIRTAGEAIGTGRGAKMNDLNPAAWDSPPFNHPSKKDWKKFNANESTDIFIEAEETQEESMPKQTDKKESDKNGVNRKKLYIAFIEWCKTFNDKNTFGSMFDKDVFHVTYPFVPESMRYFYRLANPLMCVLSGNLTFFQLSELRKVNAKNSQLANMMIFAATENDMRVLNVKDGAVYMATDENGAVKLGAKLADTFDLYIQTMIDRGDILNGADPNKVPDAPPELDNTEETSEENNETEDIMNEPIEDTQEDNPESSEEPPELEDNEESK